MNLRIVLFGSSGQIGFELAKAMASLGEVIALKKDQANFNDYESLRRIVQEYHPEIIVNAAAFTAVDNAENENDTARNVNAIAPGWFPSEMTGAWVRQSAFRRHISNNSPMGRIGKPDELTGTLLLLASEASSFINGQVISVDGGISSSMGLPFFTEEMFQYMEKAVPGDMAKRIRPD